MKTCQIIFDEDCLLLCLVKIKDKDKDPLFTLGSVYSPKASGAEQTTETNNSNLT